MLARNKQAYGAEKGYKRCSYRCRLTKSDRKNTFKFPENGL